MRWSYLPPPSPTPSHNSSTNSLISEANTITTTGSDTPSLQSRTFLSVIRASIVFPLSSQKAPEAVKVVVPPSPPLSSPVSKDNNNSLVGLKYRVDEATIPFAINANTKNNNSDDSLAWKPRFKTNVNEYEYETMPLKRRQEALARVNKLRLWLNDSEKNWVC